MDTYSTRCTLLARAQNQHDSVAWEELIVFYKEYIKVIIRSMNVPTDDIDDVCQQILVKLWKYLPEFTYDREQSTFRHWLAVIAKSQVLNYFRSKGRHNRKLDEVQEQDLSEFLKEMDQPEIEAQIEHEWKLFITNKAMTNIEKNFTARAVDSFKRYSHGESVTAIAESLEVKEDSVYKFISRIKIKLIQEIDYLKKELEF